MIKSSSQSRSSSFLRSRFHDYTGKRGRSRTSKPTQNHHVCFQSFGRVNGFVTIAQKADDDDCDDVVARREFDLLIVGPGVLGTLVAKKWIEKFPNCRVVGQTKTEKNHQMLKKKGIEAKIASKEAIDENSQAAELFPFVVFSAPPSGSDDYQSEIKKALMKWDPRQRRRRQSSSTTSGFCFTSSSAVFPDNVDCDDQTETLKIGENARADRLLNAEKVVLEYSPSSLASDYDNDNSSNESSNKPAVLRLAGLYHSTRGAHTYFMKAGTIDSRPDALVNCIHYEDAADLVVKVLLREDTSKNIFLGCDGEPITREDVAICALESGCFDLTNNDNSNTHSKPTFTKTDGPLGRRMTCERTMRELFWRPKYESFRDFFAQEKHRGVDSFSASSVILPFDT